MGDDITDQDSEDKVAYEDDPKNHNVDLSFAEGSSGVIPMLLKAVIVLGTDQCDSQRILDCVELLGERVWI
jgi:hypothetical protein